MKFILTTAHGQSIHKTLTCALRHAKALTRDNIYGINIYKFGSDYSLNYVPQIQKVTFKDSKEKIKNAFSKE